MHRSAAKNLVFLSALAIILASFSTAHAQLTSAQLQQEIQNLQNQGFSPPTPPTGFSSDSISVNMTPTIPGPNQVVSISLVSYSTDLNRAAISWYQDNKLIGQGTGLTSKSVSTGNAGTETAVLVVVVSAEGNTTRLPITLIPAEVDLVWQADTYVPPFYEGKALYTHQSGIRIAAIPNFVTPSGKRLDPKTLVYSWKRDDGVNGTVSGYGMQSFDIKDNIPDGQVTIDVSVTSADKTISAEKQITIESGMPKVMLYRDDPLLGTLYQSALGEGYALTDKEVDIAAVPYFFSTSNAASDMGYTWYLNSQPIAGQTKQTLVLRNQNDQSGSSLVSVDAKQILDDFQTASANLTILFGDAAKNGLSFPL